MVEKKPTKARKKQPVQPPKKEKAAIQPVNAGIDENNGRKTETDRELWARRADELRLYSMGIKVYKICEQFRISRQTFYVDMKAIAEMQQPLDEIHSIKEGINEVISRAFMKGELKVALDAITAKAKINGLIEADATNVNNTTIINAGNGEAYDPMSDDEIQAEYQRRLQLKVGKGVKKK